MSSFDVSSLPNSSSLLIVEIILNRKSKIYKIVAKKLTGCTQEIITSFAARMIMIGIEILISI